MPPRYKYTLLCSTWQWSATTWQVVCHYLASGLPGWVKRPLPPRYKYTLLCSTWQWAA
ncbi:MAG: hypothetical protein M5U34_30855 [Chloroflexi bacterium]|nr:hypothetical protein [Chloroflexota bacterium]